MKLTVLRSQTRVMLILAILIALVASAFPGVSYAEGEWTLIYGTVTVVNNGAGNQIGSHIGGELVTYASDDGVHYYNLNTQVDAVVPHIVNSSDFLANNDGTNVVYTHVTSDAYEINIFDVTTGGAPVTLDPQPAVLREKPAIGGQVVAWAETGINADPNLSEIVVYDLVSGTTNRLTNDLYYDTNPSVSPDGSLIVWTKCQGQGTLTGCHTWQAASNGNGWDVAPLAGSGEQLHPSTDGQYIVYYGYYDSTPRDVNVFWQRSGVNEEHEMSLPGTQRNPSIDAGVMVFETYDDAASNWELMLYDLNNARGYQITDTVGSEILPDIAVAPDGSVHVVWQEFNAANDSDIYTGTFQLPETGNQPPVVDYITAPLDPAAVNTTVSVSAGFSDPDSADTHTAYWDWGDGSASSGTVNESSGNGTASGSHTYTTPGVYIVTLTITDNHNAEDTKIFQYVVVYNPVGGFVTGSGWITSPAGAYALDPALAGKANFGFVSRYQKGASLPSGTTEFQFKAGGLSFRSTAYDWLVIAGAKAQFKGVGTISGSGDYGFLLTVTDGQVSGDGNVDKFRIKIWDRSSGSVVYDNQLGADETSDPVTVLGGGSVVIHK